jgi:hypothetical protein
VPPGSANAAGVRLSRATTASAPSIQTIFLIAVAMLRAGE